MPEPQWVISLRACATRTRASSDYALIPVNPVIPVPASSLWPDLDDRAVRNQLLDLFNLFIRDRNAAPCPIALQMSFADGTLAVWKPVYEDVASRLDTEPTSTLAIRRVGIRNMQRLVKLAPGIPSVDPVRSLRGAHVAFLDLRSHGMLTQGHSIRPEDFAVLEQEHLAAAFVDHDPVGLCPLHPIDREN